MALLKTENISVSFDEKKIIQDISVELHKGELVSLLGVSGSGKSTLFNVIAGLIQPDSGSVFLNGMDITGKSGFLSYMLQKDLLLPYKTIVDNVALPLTVRGMRRSEARRRVLEHFEEFGLKGTERKYPGQLSGGMRQRAALLRTYMFSDEVALLDEPFSALDAITKDNMHKWYLDIMKRIKLSTLFITHDIDEAILLSDRIYILGGSPGRITHELVIEPSDVRSPKLMLSESFLAYKKNIIGVLSH
ncbi:MAG: ABC transporter ATP-binding protein [Butyrivibrio sp.]|nr:ABC transporter ATP-binding protein [Butyrivibrio sp.]